MIVSRRLHRGCKASLNEFNLVREVIKESKSMDEDSDHKSAPRTPIISDPCCIPPAFDLNSIEDSTESMTK